MLYKNYDYSLETNIEARRKNKQYFHTNSNTNSGAGREYYFATEFTGSDTELKQIGRGYIINDSNPGTLYVKFKFRMVGDAADLSTEAWSDGIEVLPNSKHEFYTMPLISAIRVENVPSDPGLNLNFRIFAT